MAAYYNENDPYAAQWLRNLVAAGHITPGDVDDRGIKDVTAEDLDGYVQCHFFAGIGGWSYALRLASWPDARPVWTGSCPCQPFSIVGKRKGVADERHLWPEFRRLISECHPPTVFGEQVASRDGRRWLAGVRADLESLGYGVGAADLCAAGIGAPHVRQRLWWVGDTTGAGLQGWQRTSKRAAQRIIRTTGVDFWSDFEVILCTDKKLRRIEPGTFPLVDGVSNRVGKLRAYGNAIVPQVAAGFISAALGSKS